jgi:hypothetical protein
MLARTATLLIRSDSKPTVVNSQVAKPIVPLGNKSIDARHTVGFEQEIYQHAIIIAIHCPDNARHQTWHRAVRGKRKEKTCYAHANADTSFMQLLSHQASPPPASFPP